MLDPVIRSFLDERKALWLKKKVNTKTTEAEQLTLEQEASALFALDTWLPDAAKRAKQLSLVSHPSKFSHPSAKTSSIIAQADYKTDGYLRTGNVKVDLDVFGNAAAMDVYKFLSLQLQDGKTILAHLEQASDLIQQQFNIPNQSFPSLATELLMIKDSDAKPKTSERVKQVYFPLDNEQNEYHLLSVLTSSGMVYEQKKRIRELRFSDNAVIAFNAKKTEKYSEHGYSDFSNLTAIGFGGTKPQNISVLNSQNGGVAHLLLSAPPPIDKRRVIPPRSDFFQDSLHLPHFASAFQAYHNALVHDGRAEYDRLKREGLLKDILYQAIQKAWEIRYLDAGWSQSERYHNLPYYQKLWLDQYYRDSEDRQDHALWLDKVKDELAWWFQTSYKKQIGKEQHVELTDQELKYLRGFVDECEEALK